MCDRWEGRVAAQGSTSELFYIEKTPPVRETNIRCQYIGRPRVVWPIPAADCLGNNVMSLGWIIMATLPVLRPCLTHAVTWVYSFPIQHVQQQLIDYMFFSYNLFLLLLILKNEALPLTNFKLDRYDSENNILSLGLKYCWPLTHYRLLLTINHLV